MASVNKKFNVDIGLQVGDEALHVEADTSRTGVGKTNPGYVLDVAGTANFDGVVAAGQVGVGSTQPVYDLDVATDARIKGRLFDTNDVAGNNQQALISVGTAISWTDLAEIETNAAGLTHQVQYRKANGKFGGADEFYYDDNNDRVGIGTTQPEYLFQVQRPAGDSSNGFVQIGGTFLDSFGGVGLAKSTLIATEEGELQWVGAGVSEFNVIFVTEDGDDLRDGLTLAKSKRTIKSALSVAVEGQLVKVSPGVYREDNPISMPRNTTVDGDDLRNTQVIPINDGKDLFQVDNGCFVQNLSFIGSASTGAMIAYHEPRENIHTFISADAGAIAVGDWDTKITPTFAVYGPKSGIMTVTVPEDHGIEAGVTQVGFATASLDFTCRSDNNNKVYSHPRVGEPLEGVLVSVSATTTTSFTADVGIAGIGSEYVGFITQSPYIRNCTNFVPDSIGMKIDGNKAANLKSMVVDSYTQYNQGGIGVSITNNGYAQLVSIFTICDDIAIYCGSGGQCDLTNSNSSFGNKGLIASGVGTETVAGTLHAPMVEEDNIVTVTGIGTQRPFTGQVFYVGELFYNVEKVNMTSAGSGYTSSNPPAVTFSDPSGPGGIQADGVAVVSGFGSVTAVNMFATGRQYRYGDNPTVTIAAPASGETATGTVSIEPTYYTINSATTPTAGVSTITVDQTIPANVGVGSTIPFFRQSLILASSHSFEYIGTGVTIAQARPSQGGVTIPENQVQSDNGGKVVHTSTDERGNFLIGDDFTINQQTGTITGDAFNKSIQATLTPLIIALGGAQ